MIRGTTPTLTFTTPYKANEVADGYITFTMQGKVILDIETTDNNVVVLDKFIKLDLTQEQTLLFDANYKTLAQIRLILTSGRRVASNIVNVPIGRILKEGVI